MKRVMEMEGETPLKRPRPAGDTELRLLIQSKAAGSVIGKGGQNISRLRSENPASITVPDCPGPERVLTIGGSEDVVLKVLNEVLQCLDEALQKGPESDARILVHQSQAGCVIGKGGSKIKELREVSTCSVSVFVRVCVYVRVSVQYACGHSRRDNEGQQRPLAHIDHSVLSAVLRVAVRVLWPVRVFVRMKARATRGGRYEEACRCCWWVPPSEPWRGSGSTGRGGAQRGGAGLLLLGAGWGGRSIAGLPRYSGSATLSAVTQWATGPDPRRPTPRP
ncbi:hypothetical protein Pcinc_001819 [Petrolisthes cinctipes]|uniref:K Homology domain-containing protein n=1 Tax=Petrolisthes cinctipes TaxID=88211 RepID=A0AAE1GQX5_PETCI|nr:hypothetical protein Pcinc_001819 [Petrolisthes cinctipes]